MSLSGQALAIRREVNQLHASREREREERAAAARAEIGRKEIRDEKGVLVGYTDQEPGGTRHHPYPLSCAACRAGITEPGGPEHQYGLTRGHRAHCTCNGCF